VPWCTRGEMTEIKEIKFIIEYLEFPPQSNKCGFYLTVSDRGRYL
jgi:hypothetical protein